MRSSFRLWVVVIGVAGFTTASAFAWADDSASTKKSADGKKTAGALPDYFGKLELDDEQKDKVRSAVASAQSKIQPLRDEIRKIEQARDKEVRTFLTAAQKSKLESLQAAAKADRMAKRKSAAAKAKSKAKGVVETGKGAGN